MALLISPVQPTYQDVPLLQILMWTWRLLLHLENGHTSHPQVHSLSHTFPLRFSKVTISMLWLPELLFFFFSYKPKRLVFGRATGDHFFLTAREHMRARWGWACKEGVDGIQTDVSLPPAGQCLLLSDSYIWKSESAWIIMWEHWKSPFLGRGVFYLEEFQFSALMFQVLSIWSKVKKAL
jgi:hypothetical protein